MRQPKPDRLTARNPRLAVSNQTGQVMSPFFGLNSCPSNRGNLKSILSGAFQGRRLGRPLHPDMPLLKSFRPHVADD